MFNKIVHRIRSVPLSGSHYSVDFFVMATSQGQHACLHSYLYLRTANRPIKYFITGQQGKYNYMKKRLTEGSFLNIIVLAGLTRKSVEVV